MQEYRETVVETEQSAPVNSGPGYMTLAQQYGLDDMEIGDAEAHHQATVEDEYRSYITAPLSSRTTDIIKFWEVSIITMDSSDIQCLDFQVNGSTFPTLFKMAMDYLPIQASAVPCERVFSSSAETDTSKRNRIGSLLMEALQMLKFHLKKERLNFTEFWKTQETEMTEDDPEVDLLNNLLRGNVQDAFDGIMKCIND